MICKGDYEEGDRVNINSIKFDGIDKLQFELNIHSKNQSMSEAPSKLNVLELKVDEGNILGFEIER